MDMDAFYASVEILDDPSLAGKPLIIGALPSERGVVSTCSYEARKYGVHSGQSIKEAYKLCPNGIYMHGNYHRYHQISDIVHEILLSYTDQIEFIALDEGYLDITGSLSLFGPPETIGQEIRKRVKEATGLTCSVGIGYNKMTAKLGSEENKPDGFFMIPDPEFFVQHFIDRPIRIIPGIGGKTAAFLHDKKLDTLRDVLSVSESMLVSLIGESGHHLYQAVRGYGSDHVSVVGEGESKSYGKEVTYQSDMTELPEMLSTLHLLARNVSIGLQRRELFAGTVTLKIKYNDLKLHTRSYSTSEPVQSSSDLYRIASSLLQKAPLAKPVRLLGISTSSFSDDSSHQISLVENDLSEKRQKLDKTLLGLYDRFGKNVIRTGAEIESEIILKEGNKLH